MAELEKGDERRRNPRFICGGEAKINPLPSDGALVSGKLRNLSMGGICVETDHPIDLGTRTEILLNVDAVSFRTLALVRSISNRFRTNMEFVQMSAGSRDILADVLEHMSRVQKIMRKIRSAPLDAKVELSRELQERGCAWIWVNGFYRSGKSLFWTEVRPRILATRRPRERWARSRG